MPQPLKSSQDEPSIANGDDEDEDENSRRMIMLILMMMIIIMLMLMMMMRLLKFSDFISKSQILKLFAACKKENMQVPGGYSMGFHTLRKPFFT